MSKFPTITNEAESSSGGLACANNTPAWFTGHWRDWHRGHGCDRDDGGRPPETSMGKTDPEQAAVRIVHSWSGGDYCLRVEVTIAGHVFVNEVWNIRRTTERARELAEQIAAAAAKRLGAEFEPLDPDASYPYEDIEP